MCHRRIDDDFIDPKAFREDSAGVPGLLDVYRRAACAGQRPGTGMRRRQGHLRLRSE